MQLCLYELSFLCAASTGCLLLFPPPLLAHEFFWVTAYPIRRPRPALMLYLSRFANGCESTYLLLSTLRDFLQLPGFC